MPAPLPQRVMTLKQQLFAKNYLANGYNAAQAALDAGYSKDSLTQMASENLAKPVVKEYIAKIVEKKTHALDITFEWKLLALKNVAEISLEPHGKDDKIYPSAAVSAIAELNKMQGDHAPVKTANLNVNVDASLEDVHELMNLYQQEY